MENTGYVHGYSEREAERLLDQAGTLTELLHHDTFYPPGSHVLEAGCGVGAQTVTLASRSPGASFTSIDFSADSLVQAEMRVREAGIRNVEFRHADIYHLPFVPGSFDHVFVCFVLEHLADPGRALACLKKVIRPGGTVTVIEGDHGSAFYYPRSSAAQKTIDCLVKIQAEIGGNALIGRELYPLLADSGFASVTVSPRMVYADPAHPGLVTGFTKQTFIAMVEGVKDEAITRGLIDPGEWEKGIHDLNLTSGQSGVFCYTFFKGRGTV